jgi:lipid II:glycine glycyltransferase (peptidoglycan interpeptide bridge formation enzyme)
MMGGAPTGFDEHPLTGVSAFKESLGGSKIELYGNFDLVLNR